MSNRKYTQFFYTPHAKPVLLDTGFTVAAADAAGNGVTTLTGPSIQAVYMHTSATASAGNPNPASGIIVIQLQDGFNAYFGGYQFISTPLTGTPVTAPTVNVTYVITALGTATLAQWQAAGLPVGIKPAIGASFVCIATGTIGGSAAVQAIATAGSGIDHMEVVGVPNTTINPSIIYNPLGQATYGQVILACFKNGVLTAPTDGTLIRIGLYFSNSTVSFGAAG